MKTKIFIYLFPVFLIFSIFSCASAGGLSDGFGMGSAIALRNNYSEGMLEAYKTLNNAGISYVREEIIVGNISDLNNQKRMIEAARNQNLKIVGLLTYGFGFTENDDDFFEKWEDAVDKIVKELGYGIDYWEIGNEMNCIEFWKKVRPNAQAVEVNIYAEMLNRAYKIIKKYDPDDRVILGGLIASADFKNGYDPADFLRNAEKYWDKPPFDAIGLHIYWGAAFPDMITQNIIDKKIVTGNMADYIRLFNESIIEIFEKEYPIWITEVGYSNYWLSELYASYNHYEESTLQAIGLIRTYTMLLSTPPVEKVFWYTYSPDIEDVYVINDISLNVLRTLYLAINDTMPLGRFRVMDTLGKERNDLCDYRFLQNDGQTISIFWSNDKKESSSSIKPPLSSSIYLFDIENKTESQGIISFNEGTKFYILNIPVFIVGKMDNNESIVVTNDDTPVVAENKPAVRPLIYTKEGNVYVYDPEKGVTRALTFDGGLSGGILYYNAMLSPDSKYVGVELSDSFMILDLQGNILYSWKKYSKPDIYADTLVGWDDQNYLYFTRTIGDCIFTDNEIIGPDHVELVHIDPKTGESETLTNLAKLSNASHAYSIGDKISNDGKYISMINAACSIGISDERYYMNIETGDVIQESDYLKIYPDYDIQFPIEEENNYMIPGRILSPDHNYVAYIRFKYSEYDGEYFVISEEADSRQLFIASTKDLQNKLFIDYADDLFGWSPDQTKLAYIRKEPGAGGLYPPSTLYILDLTVGQIIQIDNGLGIKSSGW